MMAVCRHDKQALYLVGSISIVKTHFGTIYFYIVNANYIHKLFTAFTYNTGIDSQCLMYEHNIF